MTTPRYPMGCSAGSQACGKPWSSDHVFFVNFDNGNVNNNHRDNRGFVRAVCSVPAGECQGAVELRDLYRAMLRARRKKKPSVDQLAFDARWGDGLLDIQRRLVAGTWSPAPAICFIAGRPKAREIHAPAFRDRVVHHYAVPPLESHYEPRFIAHSFANRRGKGAHAAVQYVYRCARQVASGQGGGWYLKLDIRNFFPSIHRPTLWRRLKRDMQRAGISPVIQRIVHALLRQPVQRTGVIYRSTAAERARVPAHKRLANAPAGCGLPIGNLTSQFFANVYLDPLDKFAKHTLRARRYARYVDDFVLIHRDRHVLEGWLREIEQFLARELRLQLKDDIQLRPLSSGIDFLGYVIYPTHLRVRRRVLQHAAEALDGWERNHVCGGGASGTPADFRHLRSIWASYDGHMAHASAWRLRHRILSRRPWLGSLTRPRMRFSARLEGRRVHLRVARGRL